MEPTNFQYSTCFRENDVESLINHFRENGTGDIKNVTDDWCRTLIFYPIRTDSAECLKVLIDHGADINDVDNTSDRVLHYAVSHNAVNCLKVLIKAGANLNVINRSGNTPLHYAAEKDNVECLKILLENGGNVNAKNISGFTPLLTAAAGWYREKCIIKLLLEYGADPNSVDYGMNTPLHYIAASQFKDQELLDVFLKYGANVNLKNGRGNTPLHESSMHHSLGWIKCLLSEGADIAIRNEEGKTMLECIQDEIIKKQVEDYINEMETYSVKTADESP